MKEFKKWLAKKESIHEDYSRPNFHEREIWYCIFGINVGFEQDGKGQDFLRPVCIMRKFNKEIFWVLPLTSALKALPYYHGITFSNRNSSLILSQIRLIDAKRLSHKIGVLSKDQFAEAIKNLKALLP